MMQFYREKPLIVKATNLTRETLSEVEREIGEIPGVTFTYGRGREAEPGPFPFMIIETAENQFYVELGDWVFFGDADRLYKRRHLGSFEDTFEPVENPAQCGVTRSAAPMQYFWPKN